MRAETKNGLNWFVCVWPVYTVQYTLQFYLLFLIAIAVVRCFRCHCLNIYAVFFLFLFIFLCLCSRISHSFCPVCRFIKQNEERKKCLFQCVLLFIINTRRSINTQTILNHSLSIAIFGVFFSSFVVVVVVVVPLLPKSVERTTEAHTKEIEYVS